MLRITLRDNLKILIQKELIKFKFYYFKRCIFIFVL
jgi:hypothetical protein